MHFSLGSGQAKPLIFRSKASKKMNQREQGTRGHPFKGLSLQKDGGQAREKTPLHQKNAPIFPIGINACTST